MFVSPPDFMLMLFSNSLLMFLSFAFTDTDDESSVYMCVKSVHITTYLYTYVCAYVCTLRDTYLTTIASLKTALFFIFHINFHIIH